MPDCLAAATRLFLEFVFRQRLAASLTLPDADAE
jgi:hypothetical protein